MHFLPVGEIYQLVTAGQVVTSGGVSRPVVNSWSYVANQLAGVGSFPTIDVWNAFIAQVWSGALHLNDRLSTAWVGQSVQQFTWDAGGKHAWVAPAPPSGTAGGARHPITTAVCCTLRTPSRGRIYTGRKLFGPIPIGDTNGEELNAGVQAVWQTIINQFLTPLSVTFMGVNWVLTPCIWSQLYSNFVPAGGQVVGDLVTVAHCNRTLSSWRHRRERTVR